MPLNLSMKFVTLKEKNIFFPQQTQERRPDSTSKSVFILTTSEYFLLFSAQHNSDGLCKTRSKSEYESLTEDFNPHQIWITSYNKHFNFTSFHLKSIRVPT